MPPPSKSNRRRVLAWFGAASLLPATAAEQRPTASLLFVNAIDDPGLAFFLVDKKDISGSGYRSGQVTGWLPHRAGARSLMIEHEPLGRASLSVKLASGSRNAVIVFAQQVPSARKGRPPVRTVTAQLLPCPPPGANTKEKNPRGALTVLSVSANPALQLKVGKAETVLERRKPHTVALPERSTFLNITCKPLPAEKTGAGSPEADAGTASPPTQISLNLQDPGSHVVVLYDRLDGSLATAACQIMPE